MTVARLRKSGFERALPFLLLAGLVGIPIAVGVALLLAVQIPRFLYGQAIPLQFVAEIGSLVAGVALVLALRRYLALPSAPKGFYRDALDFLAISGWHPSVTACFVVLFVLPEAWYIHGQRGFFQILRILRWHALRSLDFQGTLDGIAVVHQLTFMVCLPLLFALHMLSRWNPKRRFLPWLLLPAVFAGTAIGITLLVFMTH